MQHLRAGATLAEAEALGNSSDICPPLIRNFARTTWSNYSPHPLLEIYLRGLGYIELPSDPRELFYKLEEEGKTNIELFMEYAWINRNRKFAIGQNVPSGFISGLRLLQGGDQLGDTRADGFWENLLYHGIGNPISFCMLQCFHENGVGWKDLRLAKLAASYLKPGDLALNLNYDTVFELALEQRKQPFTYSPNKPSTEQLLVCKPHGSLNLVANDKGFTFGQPGWLGMPQPPRYRSYSGLIPPRLNKHYDQHPISKMILAPVMNRQPQKITMWGVGLTDSDSDLIQLYSRWARHAEVMDIINPNAAVVEKARELFLCEIRHFSNVADWDRDRFIVR